MRGKEILPIMVYPERVWRTYRGGKCLDRRLGQRKTQDSNYPEEWILSTVLARTMNGQTSGICMAEMEGKLLPLTEVLRKNTRKYSGKGKNGNICDGLDVLTKIIDAGERLTVQVHPDRLKAQKYFHSPIGKLESWHILDVRDAESCIYLGFRPGINRKSWEDCFFNQDIEKMLEWLHCIKVRPGDTFLVPEGMPHAIGQGCLLIEIQEPTDFTLRTERITPAGEVIPENLIHQGIGYEKMFDCFNYIGMEKDVLEKQYRLNPGKALDSNGFIQLVGVPHTDRFSLKYRYLDTKISMEGEDTYYGLYVWSGKGYLDDGTSSRALLPGSQFFIPAGCSSFSITADETLKIFKIEGNKYEEA